MSSTYEDAMKSKNFLPLLFDHLTPQMIQMANEELNENDNTRASAIEQLRKLILKEKDLKCRTDDEFLLQFLRARKFDVKKSFSRFQTFYHAISKSFADVYSKIDDEEAKKAFGSGFGSHLPYRDKEGAAVVLTKMDHWNCQDHDFRNIMNCCTALCLGAEDYPATQVCGLHFVVDANGTTLQHVKCLGPRYLYLVSKALRDTFPIRWKGVHLINASPIFRYIWSIINIFLSEKLRKRTHFHENMESLHKFIPKEILPTEYGGENTDFDPKYQASVELEKFLPKYFQIIHDGYIRN